MCSVPGVPTPGSEVSVVIRRVNVNPSCGLVELWVNMNKGIKHVYEQLQEEIQLPKRNFCTFDGKAGDLCLMNLDEKWHRARIVSVHEESYKVFLIDQALSLSTDSEALTWGKDQYFILPPEIESCILANVLSIDNNWPGRATNFLKSLPGKEFQGLVQHALMPDRIILLDVPIISKHLRKEGVAKRIQDGEFKNLVLKCLGLPEDVANEPMTIENSLHACNQQQTEEHFLYLELLTDVLESVIVTEVIDPGNIFCKLKIFSKSIEILAEQMNEVGKDKSDFKDLQPQSIGMPCAAKGIDGKWRRAVLKQQIKSNVAAVFFVDEGKYELVDRSNVKKLEHKFFSVPVVTYLCSLEGVKRDKEWSEEDIDHLKSLILNRDSIARFDQHSLLEDYYSVTLYMPNAECINDLFLAEEAFELNGDTVKHKITNQLILNGASHELAVPSVFPKSLEQDLLTKNYDPPFSAMEMHRCKFLTVGASVEVNISCFESTSRFWCQTSQNDQRLHVLMRDLQAHYEGVHPKPLVDSICVARNPDNNMWYRAKVIASQSCPDVEVRFIDFGQTKRVSIQELRPIDPTFLGLDTQAFQCSLFSIPPSDADCLTEEYNKYVDSNLAHNSGLNCFIKAVTTDEEGLLLHIVDLQIQSEGVSHVLSEKLALRPQKYNLSSHDIAVGSREKISISHSETVHSFFCQLDRNSHLFQQVQRNIEDFISSSSWPSNSTFAENSLCIARYSDSKWQRGNVLEMTPDLRVHFVDFGKTLALNDSDVQQFPSETSIIRTTPVLAVPVGLFNIPDEVPQVINEWFSEKVNGHTFIMSVMQKGQNGKLMVELRDGSKSLNAQVREKILNLEVENKHLCNGSKKASLSSLDSDICQPVAGQQNSLQKKGSDEKGNDDVADWILIVEPQTVSEVKETLEKILKTVIDETSPVEIDIEDETSPKPSHSSTTSDKVLDSCVYKKPILTPTKIQELHASSISSPEFFWCQRSNTGDLDKMMTLAQVQGGVAQDPFFPPTLLAGHPCLALYKSDNQWYRAQVVHKHEETFTVVFVDYGNEEDVEYKDVRPLSANLLEFAPQAFLCRLDGIECTQDKCDDMFFDEFYNTLVEKSLSIKVLGMGQNPEVRMPQYTVEIEDLDLHKLLKKYRLPSGDALDDSLKIVTKNIWFSNPEELVNNTLKVYVSAVCGPGYFWCQYNTDGLQQISKLAQKSGWAEEPLFPETLVPGSPCMAHYSADSQWYRAQVLSRNKDKLDVIFVDTGNKEEISVFSVRPIPPNLMEIQAQAFLCCLENFDENTTTWDDMLRNAFLNLFLQKTFKIRILNMVHNKEVNVPHYTVQFDFDVEKFCKSSVQPGRASQARDQDASPKVPSKAPEVKLATCKYNNPPLAISKPVFAYASSISGPEYFWCQYHDPAELDKIVKLAQIEGGMQYDPILENNLVSGSPCLALFREDNLWYRAQILGENQDNVSVLFIDYGNEAEVSVKNVRPISSGLLKMLPQGFLCCLEGFNLSKGVLDDQVFDYFFNMIVDKLLKVTPLCSVQNADMKLPQFIVQIQCEDVAVNKAMLDFWKVNCKIDDSLSNLAGNVSISEPTNLNLSKQKNLKKPIVFANRTERVYASCIVDPHYFWCQFANSDSLEEISRLAQEAGLSQQHPESLDKGDLCLALFSSDSQWYRAAVGENRRETLNVVFVDYGNESEVSKKDTRLIPQNLLEQPPQAFLCTLHGFDQSRGKWSDQGYDAFFNSLIDKCLKVTVINVEDNKELALLRHSVQIECEGVNVNEMMRKYWRGAAGQGGFPGS